MEKNSVVEVLKWGKDFFKNHNCKYCLKDFGSTSKKRSPLYNFLNPCNRPLDPLGLQDLKFVKMIYLNI